MTESHYREIVAGGGLVDLSNRSKWLLTGEDRIRYLNGQITNDARKVTPQEAVQACVTNIKGKIEGDIFIHATPGDGGGLLLDAETGLQDVLGARLERYIISDDAILSDVKEAWKLWHLFGPALEAAANLALPRGAHLVRAHRFGMAGVDVWSPSLEDDPLFPASLPVLTPEDLETWRILAGVARWPAELNGDTFPPEAGLQEKAMDFAKGCYIGQEILSRIKTTGKMPRVLVRVQARAPETVLKAGARLFTQTEDGKLVEAGQITSVTRHPVLDLATGLAYVRQVFSALHSLLPACEVMPRMEAEVAISPL